MISERLDVAGFDLVEINPLLRAVMVEHAPLATEKAIDLGLARNDPMCIMGEAESLRLLFANLLENALRYTPAGGTVDVQIIRTPEASCVTVADTGPGIPPAERLRVFDRFYRRADTSVPGSGLGLAIVDEIAHLYGASLSIETGAEGRGTKITVQFP